MTSAEPTGLLTHSRHQKDVVVDAERDQVDADESEDQKPRVASRPTDNMVQDHRPESQGTAREVLARRTRGRHAVDLPWAPSAFSVARKFDAPVVPMHLSGPWSALFHFFDRFSSELRDVTLFHELLNKQGGRVRLTMGPPVAPVESWLRCFRLC